METLYLQVNSYQSQQLYKDVNWEVSVKGFWEAMCNTGVKVASGQSLLTELDVNCGLISLIIVFSLSSY